MIDRRMFIAGVAASLLPAPVLARSAFRQLFDGRTLQGWTPVGDANWRVERGLITADSGPMSFLLSRESWRDFELRTEFRVSPDANSGIFIRCTDRTAISPATAYEVNIFDTRPDPTYGTGAIVNLAAVSPMPRAGGRWNVMRIRARGDRFDVALNGRTTVANARDAAHREGPLALQYGAGTVRFRRVEIRSL